MKKTLYLLLGIFLVFSCSTSNEGKTTIAVPLPPTNLTGNVISTTQINLSWIDNSTNETGFKIERRTGAGIYAVIGSVSTDVLTFSDTNLTPSTTYFYRVYSFNEGGISPTYSNEFSLTTSVVPTLITVVPSIRSISPYAALSGGTITTDGASIITARGVVWSTSTNPTILLNTKTTDGTGAGEFTSTLTGLKMLTTYYARAYATNAAGTAYGNEISFVTTNIEEVTIDKQIWTLKNLDITNYADGTPIPLVTDPTAWKNLTTGAWCYYNNNSTIGATFGKLYNWYAVVGIYDTASLTNPLLRKQFAPKGWHVPTDAEWTTLTTFLGGEAVAGDKLKTTQLTFWPPPNTSNNSSGFTGLPGGFRNQDGIFLAGVYYYAVWFSSSEFDASNAYSRLIKHDSSNIFNYYHYKKNGLSVRCVKD